MDQPGVALILLAGGAHSKSMDFFFEVSRLHPCLCFFSFLSNKKMF